MKRLDTYEIEAVRIYVVMGIMVSMFVFLLAFLGRIQVAHGARYERDLRRQSIRGLRIPGTRGRIFDRNGVCLADNKASYCIAIYLDELRQFGHEGRKGMVQKVQKVIEELSGALELKSEITPAAIESHVQRRSPIPLIVWRDVGEKTRALLAESGTNFPAVDIHVEPIRVYPHGKSVAHVLGYVQRASPKDDEDETPYHYYQPEMEGRQGLEKTMDKILRGRAGAQLIRVDAAGLRRVLPGDVEGEMAREPVSGIDIKTTIDLRIQQLAEAALEGQTGAVVVLDPRNGDVLAMASSPSFNPNEIVSGVSKEKWAWIVRDPSKPLLNRACTGRYAPGSIFKPVVAAAALESGLSPAAEFQCPGFFALGRTRLRCWKETGHGTLAMRKGIEQSCNTYFCILGVRCGYGAIYRMGSEMGLGSRTGIDLDSESKGRLPAPDTIRTKGDVANVSVGQGAVEVTPLQAAVLVATVGMHGRMPRPRLVLGSRPSGEQFFVETPQRPVKDLRWSEKTISVIGGGMLDVVQAPTGTGRNAMVDGVTMGGKTGTAEFGDDENEKKWGWMVVFAPFESPQYAVAMVVENAVSGGSTVAPLIRQLMKGVFQEGEGGGES